MLSPLSSHRIAILALCWLASGFFCATGGEAGFRRFAHTISPDGAYVLAWGWGEDEHPEKLKEWPPGADTAGDSVANFLVDAIRGQVLAAIPERDHFQTSDGRWKRFSGLAASWSEDSRTALAIYEGRWSDESILWIDPKKRTFVELLPKLTEAYARFLAKKENVAEAGEISFSLPAILAGGVLVLDARARPQVNKPPEYTYRLKFQVKIARDEPTCTLLGGHKIGEPPEDGKVEDELNKAYQQLRSKLNEAGRATLEEAQVRWLKPREALGESDWIFFTRMRAAFLRARLEN